MYYGMFSRVPGHLLKASSPLSSRDNQKCLQTLPNVPRAATWPFTEACVSKALIDGPQTGSANYQRSSAAAR